MLNFRFHLVSLVAVFLALAIGVVMGTTVIDRGLVATLEGQQERLSENITDLRADNGELRAEVEAAQGDVAVLEERSERLVAGRLVGVSVLLVAVRGAESDGLDALRTTLGEAGADLRGTLWLTERFALDDADEVSELASALGTSGRARDEEAKARLRVQAVERLATRLRAGSGVGGNPETAAPDLLGTLVDRSFLEYDPPEGAADDPIANTVALDRVVVASGPGVELAGVEVPDAELAAPLAVALTTAGATRSLPVVAVEASDPDGGLGATGGDAVAPDVDGEDVTDDALVRARFVGLVRDDGEAAETVSTVDNIDELFGRLAVVYAVRDLGDGRVGHYGRGPGAQSLLPGPE